MKKWTIDDEIILIEMLENDFSYLDISKKLDRTKRSIKEKANKIKYVKPVKRITIKCLNCDSDFEVSINDKREINRKFCCKSCSASFNNKLRANNKIQKEVKKENIIEDKKVLKVKKVKNTNTCLNCHKDTNNSKFCSNKCQEEFRFKNFIEDWKNDKVDGKRGEYGISHYLRKYLFIKFDNKCTKCGWNVKNEFTGNIPLEVEHIDGNSENNKEENLTLLCPNCHSLTKTYKGANRGNGRFKRKIRYKTNKSY